LGLLDDYLADCRSLVARELRDLVPKNRYGPILYDLMLEYPLRAAKGLRPALCIAVVRALGGRLEDVLRTASVLELYHNAYLIHDDIEDGSLARRGFPTLHVQYGVPIAINVGDAMLALTLRPLLDNMELLGMGTALRILEIVARMSIESAEGQALELAWIRDHRWELRDADYWHLVFKKTCWYTFIAPMAIGGIVAKIDAALARQFRRFAIFLGVAFQIRDDVLNLVADEAAYGKEIAGDLWEGKHTLILMHAIRSADPDERAIAKRILAKARADKSADEVRWLSALIGRYGSVEHASAVADRAALRAARVWSAIGGALPESVHREFLGSMVNYVTRRDR
jgi:geranylgeranyl diphosphate synthase, type II